MMKEITVFDCENVKILKLARSARSHIHRFLLILVSCQYNVVYIAPYHKQGRRSVFRIGGAGVKVLKGQNFRRASRANLQYTILRAERHIKKFECLIVFLS